MRRCLTSIAFDREEFPTVPKMASIFMSLLQDAASSMAYLLILLMLEHANGPLASAELVLTNI